MRGSVLTCTDIKCSAVFVIHSYSTCNKTILKPKGGKEEKDGAAYAVKINHITGCEPSASRLSSYIVACKLCNHLAMFLVLWRKITHECW